MRKYIVNLLFLCILLFINGCADSNRSSIAFGLNTAPVTLDPRFSTDAVSYRITRLLYRSMIDFDDQYQVIPDLATWQQLSLNHYRFTLGNEGRVFHDGSRLTAKDVKATYESVLEQSNASPHRSSVLMIEQINVIDDDVVDFKLSHEDPLFPGRMVIGILPEKLISKQHSFNRNPVGSGPMKLLDWQDDTRLSLLRLRDKQTIEFITLKDPTVRVLKLLRGEIDLVQGDLPPEIVKWLDGRDSIDVRRKHGSTFSYIGFNLKDPFTGNILIRKAIAHAIDREAIIKYVMRASARKAETLLPPDHWAGNAKLIGHKYDPEKSKALLKKAGYSLEVPLKLTYKTSNNPFRLRLATIIQDQLKSVGIEVDIRSYDWGTFYGDIKSGRFQMYSLSWVGLKMPDIFRYIFHSSAVPPNGANRGRFADKQVDAIIELAEVEVSLIKQAEYYRELQQLLYDSLPTIPLWYEDNVLAIRKDIKGYELSADGNFDSLVSITKIKNKGH
ncbi:MAG TPA: ABC transporter substrate-binding protein [Thiotrichaceae bacterium]|jgi:peptide/nickel transport system substrate-binding protein|nr:ABC transporter substrate-binding protein [Thiotrichaceae bacterium]HIM07647.1 ABC transporter substrate-binding protein [Gammaproteobacteria bacterium]